MNIGIITSGILPVPASRGGAVETLTTQFIDKNEINKLANITVFTIPGATIKEKQYTNTNFEYIKINGKIDKIYKIYCRFVRKIFNINMEKEALFIRKVNRKLKKYEFDKIIIENNAQFVHYLKKDFSDIYLHIHNDYLNKEVVNYRKIEKKCNKIIVVSEYIQKQVNTITNIEDKVRVLKNCVDIEQFNKNRLMEDRNKEREKWGIKETDIVLMFSGRITETKGVKELLKAFKMLKEKNNIKLLIVGSPWYSMNYEDEYVNKLISISSSFKENIIFTGYIPHEDLPKIHVASDIAMIPSIWEEPAGLVVLEAMSSSLPVITTNSGGIVEYTSPIGSIIINRGENLVSELCDAINSLTKDKDLRIKMGKENREYAIKFSTDYYYNDFIKLLKE